MKNNPHINLIGYVLEKAKAEPLATRIDLYEGLAAVCGDQDEQKKLKEMAAALKQADSLCREFNFNFVQKYSSTGGAK